MVAFIIRAENDAERIVLLRFTEEAATNTVCLHGFSSTIGTDKGYIGPDNIKIGTK